MTSSRRKWSLSIQVTTLGEKECLNYKTPAHIFSNQLLHFKCEFIVPRPREERQLEIEGDFSSSAVLLIIFILESSAFTLQTPEAA